MVNVIQMRVSKDGQSKCGNSVIIAEEARLGACSRVVRGSRRPELGLRQGARPLRRSGTSIRDITY